MHWPCCCSVLRLQSHGQRFQKQVLSRSGMDCEGLETLCIKDQTLTNESEL